MPEILQNPAWYHNNGILTDYNDTYQRFLGEFPAGVEMVGGYDDFKTELPEVRKALTDIYKFWIREADIDGFLPAMDLLKMTRARRSAHQESKTHRVSRRRSGREASYESW